MPAFDARVLIVLPSLGAGGSERVVTTLANHWAKQGRTIAVACFDPIETNPFYPLEDEVSLYRLDLPASQNGPFSQVRQTLKRIKALEKVYRDFKPDAVISFLTKTNVMSLLAARGSGVPVIISERNNPTLQQFNIVWRMARAFAYPQAFSFVTMTRGAAEFYPKRQRPRTRIIPNPVNLPDNWKNRRKGNMITAVGRLAEQKQFHLLIEAFAKIAPIFPDWNLTIWGEGHLRGDLEAQRARLGLGGRVRLPGLTSKPGQWVESADVLVLSSAFEGWPNVIVEGMAARLPVISFDCEHGPADMIEDGISGRLVPQNDVDALAAALAQVLGDASLRQSLAKSAGDAAERYKTELIADDWMEIVAQAVIVD